jgi:NAD(P)-dependent dehydrogenase (short-subunit alcohol dehydrogenase family)
LDAREESQVIERFAAIENDIGPIEIVISNTGGNVKFPILETTERVFYKVWKMACLTGFLSGREAAKYMLPRKKGSIFFTGATASLRGSSGFAAFSSAKFGLRALAQSLARELGPQNIHVAHLVIDAGVDTAFVRDRIIERGDNPDDLPEDTLMDPKSVAESYWMLHHQSRDAWTFEMDIRPFAEKF